MKGATMNYQFARVKKLVGLTVMAMLVTTGGWGLAPATARADTVYRDDPGCFSWCGQDHDRNFDRDRRDRDFFGDHRDFFGDHRDRDFFNPFFPSFGR
jgi:hypothetical protein